MLRWVADLRFNTQRLFAEEAPGPAIEALSGDLERVIKAKYTMVDARGLTLFRCELVRVWNFFSLRVDHEAATRIFSLLHHEHIEPLRPAILCEFSGPERQPHLVYLGSWRTWRYGIGNAPENILYTTDHENSRVLTRDGRSNAGTWTTLPVLRRGLEYRHRRIRSILAVHRFPEGQGRDQALCEG